MDTAKIVNLYTTFPEADFLDFVRYPSLERVFCAHRGQVNAPQGKGLAVTKPLKPLICVPTYDTAPTFGVAMGGGG